MRRSRKQFAADANKDRWMVSYADFVTLLFAFFVVMYAVSSVNEGKYRVLSESLSTAFNVEARTLEPIQVGAIKRSGDPTSITLVKRPVAIDRSDVPKPPPVPRVGEIEDAGDKPMKVLFEGVRASIATLSDKDLIKVSNNEFGVEIEISTSVLFESGGTRLEDQATPVLVKLADVLKPFPHDINVQGYTDNVPTQGNVYPSNWELSAARAASVVQLFARFGIQQNRLSATGYGEFRPIADNETEAGRRKNRRVIIFVPSYKDQAAVTKAIRRLGAQLDRGIAFDKTATGNAREGFRENIRESAPRIVDAPLNETRFFNPAPRSQTTGNSAVAEPVAPRVSAPANNSNVEVDIDGPHIGRQPIRGRLAAPSETIPVAPPQLEQR